VPIDATLHIGGGAKGMQTMAISVWFVDKTTGRPNRSIEARYFHNIDELLKRIVEYKNSPLAKTDYLRITAPGGGVSAEDCRRVQLAGGVVTDEFLPEVARPAG
jgi:hypothetical protein